MRFVTSGRGVHAARVARWVVAGCAMAMLASAAQAQRGGRRFGGFDPSMLGDPNSFYTPPDFKGNPPYDGRFTFARIKYRGYGRFSGREGPGWAHDYPDADVHLVTIMRELTAMRPFTKLGNMMGGVILSLDDPLLFKYPVAYLSEPGGWFPTAEESKGLRAYIQKGGFLIVDDFPSNDWYAFEAAMKKSFPELNPVEMTGKEPIFDSFFKVDLTRGRGVGGKHVAGDQRVARGPLAGGGSGFGGQRSLCPGDDRQQAAGGALAADVEDRADLGDTGDRAQVGTQPADPLERLGSEQLPVGDGDAHDAVAIGRAEAARDLVDDGEVAVAAPEEGAKVVVDPQPREPEGREGRTDQDGGERGASPSGAGAEGAGVMVGRRCHSSGSTIHPRQLAAPHRHGIAASAGQA